MTSTKNSSYGRIGNQYKSPAIGSLTIKSLSLTSADITAWKRAVDSARSALNPRRNLLYDLYNNIILDPHLASVMNKRSIAITNQRIAWVEKDADDKPNERVQNGILEKPWFYDFLKYAMETISWGHSLIEILSDKGDVRGVELINRFLVLPEFGFVSYTYNNFSPSQLSGIYYRGNPQLEDNLVEIGKPNDYGLLMTAAPCVLYKRNGIGDWAQFAELFGMPYRVGKYNPFDQRTRELLEKGMDEMGSGGYAIIPDGTSLEFISNNGTGKSEVFERLAAIMNEEISKLYLGGTMTIEDGASRAQGQVHSEGEDDINLSDMLWVEHLLNFSLKPKLQKLMNIPGMEKGNFRFPETGQIPLADRIKIDMQVSERIPFPEDYWYKTYGIEKPEGATTLPIANNPYSTTPDPDDNPDDDMPGGDDSAGNDKPVTAKKKETQANASLAIQTLYKNSHAHGPALVITAAEKKKRDEIWDRIAKGVHSGKIKPGKVDKELHQWIVDHLFKGVTTGFGGDLNKYDPETPDKEMLLKLERDVQVFSGFKAHQELRAATDLLTDENGIVRGFSEFKKAVQAIDETYNVVWLAAEYQQAIASAQMCSKWVDITRDAKILSFLQYTTAGDDRVRADHAKLDGVIKPISDPFWDKYYPPNDWGCRCDVDQLSEGMPTKMDDENLPVMKDMFALNVGKSGVVFPPKHPYYEVEKKYKKAAENNFGLDIPEAK